MPLPGRAGVHHVGHLSGVQVDAGDARRTEDVRPDQPARPGEVVQPAHPAARAPHVDDGARLERHRVAPDQFAAPVAGHHLATGPARAPSGTRAEPRRSPSPPG